MSHRNQTFLACISMTIIAFAVFLVLFWWIYPYKTIKQEQPYKVLTPVVKQGGVLQYVIKYCKYTDVIPTINRQFIDGLVYTVPVSSAFIRNKGCGEKISTVNIPKNLPTGSYKLKTIVDYQMNPIRNITHEFITEQFSVVN